MAHRRVVVTGYGIVSPLACGASATFERAARGESGLKPITLFDTTGLPCRVGGQVDDAWLGDDECEIRSGLRSRGLRLLLPAVDEAIEMARLSEVADRERIGVALGSHGQNPRLEDLLLIHRHLGTDGRWDLHGLLHQGGYDPQQFLRRKPDASAAVLAARIGSRGPSLAPASACAAGAQAIGEGARLIRDGCCDVVVAGGSESNLNFVGFIGFILLRALAERYDSAATASRPFDRRRSGFVMSEGAGIVVLEDEEHASARHAKVLGEVLGYGDSADAYHITDARPDGECAAEAMQRALLDAGVDAAEVDYVNAHGTSTVVGDLAEVRAIRRALGEHAERVPVSSNKSMLGHTIAAAGAIECILTLIGLERSVILPTINLEHEDPRCDLDFVREGARATECRVALSNSFGFGGQNACLCLGRRDE